MQQESKKQFKESFIINSERTINAYNDIFNDINILDLIDMFNDLKLALILFNEETTFEVQNIYYYLNIIEKKIIIDNINKNFSLF